MRSETFTMPELMLLVGTRVVLGVGIGLLLAGRLDRRVRVGAGCALATVGVLTTLPFALSVMAHRAETETEAKPDGPARVSSGPRTAADAP
jgi:hypothetical protein